MPQMSPMKWLMLFYFFILILFFFTIMNYYCFFYNMKLSKKDKINLSYNWKW